MRFQSSVETIILWILVCFGMTIISQVSSAVLSPGGSSTTIVATTKPTTPLPWKQSFSLAVHDLTVLLQKMYNQEHKTLPPQSPSVLHYYKDCQDAYNNGHKESTVYLIQPDRLTPFEVYCHMNTSADTGWTVVQRRTDGSENFNRVWSEYEKGFGSPSGEFWLGLEKIYRLTASAANTKLQIDMSTFEESRAVAQYSHFSLGPKSTEYKLIVSGYNGTAGDSLTEVTDTKFSTRDNDNDFSISVAVNCASKLQGGWWFYGNTCGSSNLNGAYLAGKHFAAAKKGIYWQGFTGERYSLKSTLMKILRTY